MLWDSEATTTRYSDTWYPVMHINGALQPAGCSNAFTAAVHPHCCNATLTTGSLGTRYWSGSFVLNLTVICVSSAAAEPAIVAAKLAAVNVHAQWSSAQTQPHMQRVLLVYRSYSSTCEQNLNASCRRFGM